MCQETKPERPHCSWIRRSAISTSAEIIEHLSLYQDVLLVRIHGSYLGLLSPNQTKKTWWNITPAYLIFFWGGWNHPHKLNMKTPSSNQHIEGRGQWSHHIFETIPVAPPGLGCLTLALQGRNYVISQPLNAVGHTTNSHDSYSDALTFP